MIERLVHALRVLALPAETQLAVDAHFAATAERLAGDYDDALRLARDCRQLALTDRQHAALGAVDALLSRMGDAEGERATPWSAHAVRHAPEWGAVRRAAAAALHALGEPAGPPPEPPW